MNKEQVLSYIFEDDNLGILTIKTPSKARTVDERLESSFQDISNFYKANGREPKANQSAGGAVAQPRARARRTAARGAARGGRHYCSA